jgi:uncharacterized protein YoxC
MISQARQRLHRAKTSANESTVLHEEKLVELGSSEDSLEQLESHQMNELTTDMDVVRKENEEILAKGEELDETSAKLNVRLEMVTNMAASLQSDLSAMIVLLKAAYHGSRELSESMISQATPTLDNLDCLLTLQEEVAPIVENVFEELAETTMALNETKLNMDQVVDDLEQKNNALRAEVEAKSDALADSEQAHVRTKLKTAELENARRLTSTGVSRKLSSEMRELSPGLGFATPLNESGHDTSLEDIDTVHRYGRSSS